MWYKLEKKLTDDFWLCTGHKQTAVSWVNHRPRDCHSYCSKSPSFAPLITSTSTRGRHQQLTSIQVILGYLNGHFSRWVMLGGGTTRKHNTSGHSCHQWRRVIKNSIIPTQKHWCVCASPCTSFQMIYIRTLQRWIPAQVCSRMYTAGIVSTWQMG